MDQSTRETIRSWIVEGGFAGMAEPDLVQGFCLRCTEAGVPLSRGMAIIDTLHPSFEGRVFRWRNDGVDEDPELTYGRTTSGSAAESWRRTLFFHMLSIGQDDYRNRLESSEPTDFDQIESLRADGHTDSLCLLHRFAGEGVVGDMDCIYTHWCTRAEGGFTEGALADLRGLVPTLVLALKCTSLRRIAGTLADVYLGRAAGRRVLEGRIVRGVADRIEAALWYSDLRGYTTISDRSDPKDIVPFLNDYADATISAIHANGGDVLKLIGDGVLAIFTGDDASDACARALSAERSMRVSLDRLNEERQTAGKPTTTVYLGLHFGEVFFGNIGSAERLDFTVVGPAANEVSRIASLCRSVDRTLAVSERFVEACRNRDRADLVSVGRFLLRGVSRAQELFSLEARG